MKKLGRILFSGVSITLFLAVVFSVCLWFLGGFLGFGAARPFESVAGRLVGIAIFWVIALIVILILLLRDKKKDEAMAEDIVTSAEPALGDNEMVASELAEMRDKLKAALGKLRKSKAGRRHLYELPWYVIIGPPGAGKTTAIVNSGLQFPLAEDMGKSAIGGVGGTRNCDWWFTDGAVLVDTAGRYTTQESDAEADNAAWLGFLSILKKHRPRQPVNGAIVAISLSDLSMQDEISQKSHAVAVRRRLHELREKLGVRFPVYVLFTKADLLAGFEQFFDDLGKEERGQVWGFTLPVDTNKTEAGAIQGFDAEFQLLLDRLNQQSVAKLQHETDPARRSLIAGFPQQVASVRQTARDFLTELFQENRYEQRQFLRGIYFTSGTQEGTPIDRLMLGMARTFGIGRQAIGAGQGSGRSYFLTRLFDQVIFRESGLVSADDKVERRYRWTRVAAIAAAVLVTVGLGGMWTRSYLGNRELIDDVQTRIAAYRTAAKAIPGSPVADTDLPGVVPALNILRDLPVNRVTGRESVPDGLGWGLYQGKILGSEGGQAYRAALNEHLLPRLLLRLQDQMQGSINEPDVLYEALKVYLMLGQAGPMNDALVKDWLTVDWQLSYPGADREQLRADLVGHLDALLSQPMVEIPLNGDLVARVQGVLTQMPQAQRLYNGIVGSTAATSLPQWRLTDVGGPAVARAIVRSSGKQLNEGIPGIYTYKGFHDVFLPEALGVAERIKRDAWVLGPAAAEQIQSETALTALSRDVLGLYFDDYVSAYDGMLGDIDIIPLNSPSHAAEVTNVLSGPTSPIAKILTAVADETRLTEDRSSAAEAGGEAGLDELQKAATRKVSPALQKILAASAADGSTPRPPGAYVEDRFDWLQKFVAKEDGQQSQLDLMLATLREIYQELSNIATGVSTGNAATLIRFQGEAKELPGPMGRWATQIAQGSSGISADSTRAGINARWQGEVLPFCKEAITGKYPFDRRAQAEIGLADLGRLFGPGGLIDTFFNEALASHVDTRTRPWSLKSGAGAADLGISPAVLKQMQNAAEIRDAFFPAGPQPSVQFQMTPFALDDQAQEVILEVDGQAVKFEQGRGGRPTAFKWPGDVGFAGIQLKPPSQRSESVLSRNGPWAWFRLLDAAELRRTSASDRKQVIFNVGGRLAVYEMQSGSILNPFALPALNDFSCPETF